MHVESSLTLSQSFQFHGDGASVDWRLELELLLLPTVAVECFSFFRLSYFF